MAVALTAELLRPFQEKPAQSAVITDFDGTLAPIVDNPELSDALPGTSELLDRLAAIYGCVAVVSGRPLSFLRKRLACGPGVKLRGLYGMESSREGDATEDTEAEQWRDAVSAVAARGDAEAPPGVSVERKGLTVTIHYRGAPDMAPWVERWSADQADSTGLLRHPGRMSWELVPPVPIDKGTTVLDLAHGCRAACFIGDDRGDLAAFQALDELARRGTYVLKVVVESEEVPAELLLEADVTVPGPEGAFEMLTKLAEVA
ncbi:MAG: trehalose-phosphatase [Actinobacteria bacterium]|nr:trehalose-phosphatase [Actinomycetota bacterium]